MAEVKKIDPVGSLRGEVAIPGMELVIRETVKRCWITAPIT